MTIRMLLEMAVEVAADRIALGGRSSGVTFGELAVRADSGAALLIQLRAGTLAYVGVNSTIVPELLFAGATAGIPVAPLNYRLPEDALAAQIDRLDAPVVVTEDRYRASIPSTVRVLSVSEWREESLAAAPQQLPDVSDESTAALLFTSGTTATPKCVRVGHDHLLAYVLNTVDFAGAETDECALVSVPPYHIAGIGSILTNIYSARRVVYLADFTPKSWLNLVESEQVTQAMVVPTMLARLVECLEREPRDLPSLRSIAYGGARTPAPVLRKALRIFAGAEFTNAYGLTETSSTIAVLGADDHRAAQLDRPDLLESVGRPVAGIEVQIRNDVGRALPEGEWGELWVRGPQVSGEYVGLKSVLDANGWFPTRDRARLDTSGYLFIEGRADDTIIRGGENISPAEIEDVLLAHPHVADVAVIGVDDLEWGERTVAVVVAREILEPEEIRVFARSRLRGSRTPDEVVFVDELPYSPTGKLLRRQIKSDLAATVQRDALGAR